MQQELVGGCGKSRDEDPDRSWQVVEEKRTGCVGEVDRWRREQKAEKVRSRCRNADAAAAVGAADKYPRAEIVGPTGDCTTATVKAAAAGVCCSSQSRSRVSEVAATASRLPVRVRRVCEKQSAESGARRRPFIRW